MRVAVDATNVKPGQAGIRTLAEELTKALALIPGVRVDVLATAGEDGEWGAANVIRLPFEASGPYRRAIWREARLPAVLARTGSDVLYVPAPEALRRSPIPQVITINDVGPLVAPALYGRARYLRYALTLQRSVARVEGVACISEATRLDLARVLPQTGTNFEVITMGGRTGTGSPSPGPISGFSPDDDRPICLCVGAMHRHKNHGPVLAAFANDDRLAEAHLVLVGPDYGGEATEALASWRTKPNITHLGFISPETLFALYGRATLVLAPSLHEGFGLTVLEAMAHRIPVVASPISAHREIAADAAIWVDRPLEAGCWADTIHRTLEDDGLRSDIVTKALARAERFTWSAGGAELATLLRRAVEG